MVLNFNLNWAIGHSQGNGFACISLAEGICPQLGWMKSCPVSSPFHLLCFPAHSPKVSYHSLCCPEWTGILGRVSSVSELLFPFLSALSTMLCRRTGLYTLMQWSYNYVPPTIFAIMGYNVCISFWLEVAAAAQDKDDPVHTTPVRCITILDFFAKVNVEHFFLLSQFCKPLLVR